MVVTASNDKTVILWNIKTNQWKVLEGHESEVISAKFNSDGSKVVSVGKDKSVRIWDVAKGECV